MGYAADSVTCVTRQHVIGRTGPGSHLSNIGRGAAPSGQQEGRNDQQKAIETSTGESWAAIPRTAAKVGSPVKLRPQMTMEKFESKALKRTFDRIVFATLIKAPPGDAGSHAANGTGGDATADMAAPDAEVGRIEKPDGGKTVAELWSSKSTLRDSEVIVRGKVVKSVLHVMGRNWIHLRDGSGSRADGTDDITITTSEEVPAGEIATFRGTLRVDKDYGGGYRYAVIVEAATLIR